MAFPGTYNFNYYRGDRNEFVLRPQNADRSPFDLSNYGDYGMYTIAEKRGPTRTFVKNALAAIDSENDIITCTIEPQLGDDLSPGTYVYDIQITDETDDQKVFTLLTGTITVTDDISGAV